MNFLEKSKQNMIETIVAAGIPISGKIAMEIEKAKEEFPNKEIEQVIDSEASDIVNDSELSKDEKKPQKKNHAKKRKAIKKSADNDISNEDAEKVLKTRVKDTIDEDDEIDENFDLNKRYTKAQKLQFAIDFCKKQTPQGKIFSEVPKETIQATLNLSDKDKNIIENVFEFNSGAADENIYFLYKKTSGGTLCGRTKYAYTYQPAVNSEFYQSLHASSKKLDGKDNEKLASGAQATSIQERIIGTYLAAFIEGSLTESSKFYTLSDVLYPNEQCSNENINNKFPLFSKEELNSKGIDHSWSKMFDNLYKAFMDKSEFDFKEATSQGNWICLHPDMPKSISGTDKLFGKSLKSGNKAVSAAAKDTIIPADLYLVNKRLSLDNALKNANFENVVKITNYLFTPQKLSEEETEELNSIKTDILFDSNLETSATLAMKGSIIPISLKKNERDPAVYQIINTTGSLPSCNIDDIIEIHFNGTGNSSITTNVKGSAFQHHFSRFDKDTNIAKGYFEFRWKNTGAKWQCNATVVGAKDALLGGSVKEVAEEVFEANRAKADVKSFYGENKLPNKVTAISAIKALSKKPLTIKITMPDGSESSDFESLYNFMADTEKPSSSFAGRCGLMQFLIELCNSKESSFSEIVRKAFKMDPSVQNSVKIM